MHAGTWDQAQTAASLIASYDEKLGAVARVAFSIPCCSVYLPVYWSGYLPKSVQIGGEFYEDASLWWTLERLSMLVSIDYERFSGRVREVFDGLEEDFERMAAKNERMAYTYLNAGEKEKAFAVLNTQMETQCAQIMESARILSKEIVGTFAGEKEITGIRREFLIEYASRVHMPLL